MHPCSPTLELTMVPLSRYLELMRKSPLVSLERLSGVVIMDGSPQISKEGRSLIAEGDLKDGNNRRKQGNSNPKIDDVTSQ